MLISKLNSNIAGFTAVEFLLIVITLAVIGVSGYFVAKHVNKKTISSTSNTTSSQFSNFPNGQLTYLLPSGWTEAAIADNGDGSNGLETTKQTQNYGYAEYAITLTAPTTITIPASGICGLECSTPTKQKDFIITIADFGTNGYTSAGQWYQSLLGQKFNDPGVSAALVQSGANYTREDTPDTVYQNTTFAKQSAYCINYAAVANNSLTFPSTIPKNIASGGCYILRGDRIYYIHILDNTSGVSNLPSTVAKDRASAINILSSISFK